MPIDTSLATDEALVAKKAAKAEYDRQYREKNAEKVKAQKKVWGQSEKKKDYDKKWAADNRARSNAIKKAWVARNPEKVAAYFEAIKGRKSDYMRIYYKKNTAALKAKTIEWRNANPSHANALAGKRRKAVATATPSWANKDKMNELYKTARSERKEVDHVIPLQGKLVCGLHVETNMAVVTMTENRRKGARHAH